MKAIDWAKLSACLGASLLVAVAGGLATAAGDLRGWYSELEKPPFNPPDWVFGPAWTTLYILMAVAAFLVWRRGLSMRHVPPAMSLYLAQLLLNATWTPVFFGLHRTGWALAVIALLWGTIAATIVAFRKVSGLAAGLMLPYIGWVSFAAVLNGWIWAANR